MKILITADGIQRAQTVAGGRLQRYCLCKESVVQSLSHVQLFRDPMDCGLPGSSIHGIFQAIIISQPKWVAISFCRGSPRPWDQTCISFIGRWVFTCRVFTCQSLQKESIQRNKLSIQHKKLKKKESTQTKNKKGNSMSKVNERKLLHVRKYYPPKIISLFFLKE